MSLAGTPAISIPNGLSEGLPTALQIAGPAFSENRILDAAHALEKAIGFDGSPGRTRSREAGRRTHHQDAGPEAPRSYD